MWARYTFSLRRLLCGVVVKDYTKRRLSWRISPYRFIKSVMRSPYGREISALPAQNQPEATQINCNAKAMLSGDGMVEVIWSSDDVSRFHSTWLRHNCECSNCKQESSGQKCLDATELPGQLTISRVEITDGIIKLHWKEEPEHCGKLSLKFLRENCYSRNKLKERDVLMRPRAYTDEGIPSIEYEELADSTEGRLRLMSFLNEYGICLIRGLRTKKGGAIELAEMIAPVQPTIYGKKFDVVNTPEPINIAYSSVNLDLHIDLAYYESPPGLQVFNCIRFDDCVQGGESIFLDAFPVAEEFRKCYPKEFKDLARIPATFQKVHFNRVRPVYMTFQRPHITLNPRGEIAAIFWSPAFEGPLSVDEEDVDAYYAAYRLFSLAIRRSSLRKSIRLAPGMAVVFNNRRVLHGRNEFSLNGGQRHFEGCYVNIDEFNSHFRYLAHFSGSGVIPKRVGNQCFF